MYEEQSGRNPLAAATAVEPIQSQTQDIEQIFRNHHALVFRTACRVTGNPTDAEDVLQTVFLRLLRRQPEAEAVSDIESYLYRAAVNSALDIVRARHAVRSVPLEEVAPQLAEDSSLAPDRVHSAGELRRWLRHAVARLSPRAAEMFVLRFFEGMDNPDIARILKTTQGTVAVTLSRARGQIEQELHSYMGGKS